MIIIARAILYNALKKPSKLKAIYDLYANCLHSTEQLSKQFSQGG